MAKTKTSSAVKNRYAEKVYDRVALIVPKGQKLTIQAAAGCEGESLNEYINKAILQRMGLAAWPGK